MQGPALAFRFNEVSEVIITQIANRVRHIEPARALGWIKVGSKSNSEKSSIMPRTCITAAEEDGELRWGTLQGMRAHVSPT